MRLRGIVAGALLVIALGLGGCAGAHRRSGAGPTTTITARSHVGFFENFIGKPAPAEEPVTRVVCQSATHREPAGTLPELIGDSVQVAYARLHATGERVSIRRPFATGSLEGVQAEVEGMSPRAGTRVRAGSTVTLVIGCLGLVGSPAVLKSDPGYRVPDFVGDREAAVLRWLGGKALYLDESFGPLQAADGADFSDNYRVSAQAPLAGQTLHQGHSTASGGYEPTPLIISLTQHR